ncbi:MAG: hypothetical protein KatS3mg023_2804 [Armatimonadota bacterium]|nr:MAG: hypothetical protein KatS3mg023_2804 [Armatimonadota bacterium]
MEAQMNLSPKQAPPERMTLEEFLQWADEDVWAEWIEGEVRFLSPARRAQLLGQAGVHTWAGLCVRGHKPCA